MEDILTEPAAEREAPVEGYLTMAQAARVLGVSLRTVYAYTDEGKLEGERVGKRLMVREEAVRAFQRPVPGRIRSHAPAWHLPPAGNCSYVTTMVARVLPGQGERLEELVRAWRREQKHLLPGTAARYVVRGQGQAEEVMIVLVWREAVMPDQECRETGLASLQADLAEVVEWETAVVREGRVLLQT